MLVVTPVLRALRRHHPTASIDVLTSTESRAVLSRNPHVERVFTLRSRRIPRAINVEQALLLTALRARAYDTVFLLEGAERYQRLASAMGARRVLTFASGGRPPDATHASRGAGHELDNFFAVLALDGVLSDGDHYEFPLREEARVRARALLATDDSDVAWVGVHTGFHRRRWHLGTHAKAWPTERWRDVIRQLAREPGHRVVLTGSIRERAFNQRLLAELPAGTAFDVAGATDLETLGALIAECAVFISSDTGPAHLAAAVGTPLVALFGPKAPHVMGPRGDERRMRLLWKDALDARGNGDHHPRMSAIGVTDVLEAADAMLRTSDRAAARLSPCAAD